MQFKKGKVLFGYKDTWDMDEQLSTVIVAGLLKFKEVINTPDSCKGVPASISCELIENGVVSYGDNYLLSDEDFKKCEGHFDWVLDEMIYAFEDNAIDITKYDFDYTYDSTPNEKGGTCNIVNITCTNESESTRYEEDMKAHSKRCLDGRLLFAKHFDSLWW